MIEIHGYDIISGIEYYKIFKDNINDVDTTESINNLNKYITNMYYWTVPIFELKQGD